MSFNVLMQTCFSVGAPVVPSTVPQAAEEPVTPSQTPPICAGSKQPLSVAHWKHEAPRDVRQAVVVLSLLGVLLFNVVAWVERLALPWNRMRTEMIE